MTPLPEYAEKVYGAVLSTDANGRYTVDVAATETRRAEMRKERIARSKPTRAWMAEERQRILDKDASLPVRHMYATSFGLSGKFLNQFRDFWDLPEDWTVTEDELGVPSFGSRHRSDLSHLPDVRPVVLVEE